jgi:hypothetical protein
MVKEDEMGRACSTHGAKRNAYKILIGKARRKETFRKTQKGWEYNIKTDLREVGWRGMD